MSLSWLFRLLGHQNWMRHGGRAWLIDKIYPVGTKGNREFSVPFEGKKYEGSLNSYIDWYVYFFGAYDRECLNFMKNLLRVDPESIFFDIGANVGHHSVFLSGSCKQIHAFEPYDVVRNKMITRVSFNHVTNVEIHPVGLGEVDEKREFYAPMGTNLGTGSFVESHDQDHNQLIGSLSLVKGDDYVESLKLNRIDLIKVDVEGFEKIVLAGLRNTLIKYRPKIVVEFTKTTMDSYEGISEIISQLPENYKIKRIVVNRPLLFLLNLPKVILVTFDYNSDVDSYLLMYPEGTA
ncbi:MAG: FkbM family methyltransferase [Pontiella sp.]